MLTIKNLDSQNLPNAKVGYTYPIFDATAFDSVTGTSEVELSVFYNYFANQRFETSIVDGRFLVSREGRFTIEYKSKDNFWEFNNRTSSYR